MLSSEDIVDVLWDELKEKEKKAEAPRPVSEKDPCKPGKGRKFLSEYEIKRCITSENILRIGSKDIVSPLASDWLLLKGVKIIREAN